MSRPPYWVEAQTAVKGGHVIAYGVWHIAPAGGRVCIHKFSVNRNGNADVALHLANLMRDDLNDKDLI